NGKRMVRLSFAEAEVSVCVSKRERGGRNILREIDSNSRQALTGYGLDHPSSDHICRLFSANKIDDYTCREVLNDLARGHDVVGRELIGNDGIRPISLYVREGIKTVCVRERDAFRETSCRCDSEPRDRIAEVVVHMTGDV